MELASLQTFFFLMPKENFHPFLNTYPIAKMIEQLRDIQSIIILLSEELAA
jgi:hypothetical protein